MKLTAVDFLVSQIGPFLEMDKEEAIKVIEQAKAKEKEQIITAMIYTFNQENTLPYGMEYLLKRDRMREDFENYYNETYNK
jgi:hypothetical protein